MKLTGSDKRLEAWHSSLHVHAGVNDVVRARFGPPAETGVVDRVLAAYQPPAWAVGLIGVLDAMVLRAMVHGVRPERVVEIGTAAGTSALLLAAAMREIGRREAGCVRTYDLHPWYYSDRARRVGSAVDETPPAVASAITRHVGKTAIDAGRELAGTELTLAFIDADHRHPMPTADLLGLLPALAPGPWVVLHDIDLPASADRYERAHGVSVDWKQHGAQWRYECWPFEKLAAAPYSNIGAVRIPTDARVRRSDLWECLSRPWEVTPDSGAAGVLAA